MFAEHRPETSCRYEQPRAKNLMRRPQRQQSCTASVPILSRIDTRANRPLRSLVSIVTEISPRGAYKANNDLENHFRELLFVSIARGSKSQTTGSP